jgi:hypothetical protein
MLNYTNAMNFEEAIALVIMYRARGWMPRFSVYFENSPLTLVKD